MEKLIITAKGHKLLPSGKDSNSVLFSLSKISGKGFKTALALSLFNFKKKKLKKIYFVQLERTFDLFYFISFWFFVSILQ